MENKNEIYRMNNMGKLSLVDGDLTKIKYGIFLYLKNEDLNTIDGTAPLIFDSIENMIIFLTETNSGRKDFREWLNKNYNLVIRSYTVIE